MRQINSKLLIIMLIISNKEYRQQELNCITNINYVLYLIAPVRLPAPHNNSENYVKAIVVARQNIEFIKKLVESDREKSTGLRAEVREMEGLSWWLVARSKELLSVEQETPPTDAKSDYQIVHDKLATWPEAERTRKGLLIFEEAIRSMIRCEKDCLYFKKFRHSKEKDKRRTDLICALEEAQKNKHFNYSKQEFYRSKKHM